MQRRILVVEAESGLAAMLEQELRRGGYAVTAARDGRAAIDAALSEQPPDLVLLAAALPDIPGTAVCRELRARERTRETPIVMVTARGEERERVAGFEAGADDCVDNPQSTRELLLRIRAILRRAGAPAGTDEPGLAIGIVRIDPESHRAWVEDAEVVLTALELELLRTLMEQRGRVQSRERLLGEVWDIHAAVTTRTVDTHVKRLRKNLGPAAKYIQTVRGVGYRLEEPDE